jgi:predicted ATPase
VLVSGATAELLEGTLPKGTALRDMGLHRLKDLGRPEHVFQLEAPFLADSFPPLASLDNPELPNNLPSLPSAFVGRERELAEVRELVRTSRIVTLTGAGGCGKTRLALQAAADQIGVASDGVWLAEPAPLTDGGQIAGVVAAALGLQEHVTPLAADAVTEALASQEALILLDNCEHMIEAAAKFCGQVIRHCAKVRFLATSREPLGIDGEHVYRVPSLSLPLADVESLAELTASDAIRLFAERAGQHQPGFRIDQQSAPLAATVCHRLDGIPLALELAAARLSSMSLAQVAARLDQRFRLLTGGSRNAMPRQQTLQATVDWSFGLLTDPERQTLTRLSVFAGGFDLDAAEAICTTPSADALDVLDLLGSLVDKSLVVADYSANSVRHRMLETIRQYSAQELPRAAGDAEVLQIRDKHADYYLQLAEIAAPALTSHEQGEWLRRLDTEWDNLRVAFAHLAAEDRADDILRLTVWLLRFSISRGHADVLGYARPRIDRTDAAPSALLAEAMAATGQLLSFVARTDAAELAAAKNYGNRALAMARTVDNRRAEAHSLSKLVESAHIEGDMATVQRLARQGVVIARELADVQLLGEQLQGLAAATEAADERRSILQEALACCRESGDDLLAASVLNNLSSTYLHAGQIDKAATYLEQAVALAERIGGDLIGHFLRCNLSLLRLIQGQYAEASPLVRTCLLVSRRLGPDVALSSEMVFAAACCAARQGDYLRAARLFGAGDTDIKASLEIRVIKWSPAEQELREIEQGRLCQLMGHAAYKDAYESGALLPLADAIELALGRDAASLTSPTGTPARSGQ